MYKLCIIILLFLVLNMKKTPLYCRNPWFFFRLYDIHSSRGTSFTADSNYLRLWLFCPQLPTYVLSICYVRAWRMCKKPPKLRYKWKLLRHLRSLLKYNKWLICHEASGPSSTGFLVPYVLGVWSCGMLNHAVTSTSMSWECSAS